MGDIRIDYDLMHNLANQMFGLRDKLTSAAKANHDFRSTDIGPDPKSAAAISDFYGAWRKAFSRAGDAMTSLGNDFDAAGKAFFDADAQMAVSVNQNTVQSRQADWEAKKQAYDQYMAQKGKYDTTPETNPDGSLVLSTQPVLGKDGKPVIGPDGKPETEEAPVMHQVPSWNQKQADQMNPGPQQNEWTEFGSGGRQIHTKLIYNGNQVVGSQSQVYAPKGYSDVTAPTDLQYTENTTYTANGGYTTDIHFADGTEQKIVVVAQPDGTATKSVYNGASTDAKNLSAHYTGNVKTGQWTQAWNSQTSSSNDNPQNPDDPNTDPEYYDFGTGH